MKDAGCATQWTARLTSAGMMLAAAAFLTTLDHRATADDGPAGSGKRSPAAGPDIRPANASADQKQTRPATGSPGSGWSVVTQAYEKTKTSRTASDYGSIIALCEKGISLGVAPESEKYAHQLMAWAHNRRGELLASMGREKEAFADFQASVRLDKTRWRAFHNRGVSYALRGNHEKALADFRRTIELNPRYANAHFNRGEIYYELGELDRAIKDYSVAVQLAPDDATAFNSRGHAHFRTGQYREAARDYTEALRLDPQNVAALTNRGELFSELGYFAQALRDLRQATKIDPRMGRAHQGIAWLLATCPDERYRDPDEALVVAKRALELDGEADHRYLDTLAAAHAGVGQFEEALQWGRRAVQMAPDSEVNQYQSRVALYEQQKPFHASPKTAVDTASREEQDRR